MYYCDSHTTRDLTIESVAIECFDHSSVRAEPRGIAADPWSGMSADVGIVGDDEVRSIARLSGVFLDQPRRSIHSHQMQEFTGLRSVWMKVIGLNRSRSSIHKVYHVGFGVLLVFWSTPPLSLSTQAQPASLLHRCAGLPGTVNADVGINLRFCSTWLFVCPAT